jgi:hypothetical protein
VAITFLRDGKTLEGLLTTREQPNVEAVEAECREWGFTVQEITDDMAHAMQISDRSGVLISGIRSDSVGEKAGLLTGDILRRLEGRDIHTIGSFNEHCRDLGAGRTARILAEVTRGQILAYHVIKPVYGPEGGRVPPARRDRTDGGAP